MPSIKIECPVCEEFFELDVNVEPFVPARTYGPPENCSPAEGGEVELSDAIPKACPECDTVWTPEQMEDVEHRADRAMEDFEPDDDFDPGPEREYYEDR